MAAPQAGELGGPVQDAPSIDLAAAPTLVGIRAGLVVLNVLAIALCAAMLHWRWQGEIDESKLQAANTAALLARGAAATFDKASLAVAGVVDQVEKALAAGTVDPRIVWPMVDKAAARVPEVQTIGLFDSVGRQVCGLPAERCRHLSVADRTYFAKYKANPNEEPQLFGPMASRLDGKPVLILAKGVHDASGGFGGVAIALLPLQGLASLVSTASLGPNGVASLRTEGHLELLMRVPPLPAEMLSLQRSSLSAQFQETLQRFPDAGVIRAQSAADGATRVNAYRKLSGYPIYAIVGDAEYDSMASWRASLWWTVGFLLVFASSSVVIERVATRSHRQQALARQLYESAPCGYHTLDADGRYTSINATELRWLGCSAEEVVGKLSPKDFYSANDGEEFAFNFERLLAGTPLQSVERNLISRDGTVRQVSVSAAPVFDAHGNFVSSNSVVHDITVLKRAEETRVRAAELEAQNLSLTESARLKDQFLANISHELRTPLNAVIGFSHLLQMPAAQESDKRAKYVQRIGEAGQHLLELVNTMLDFGKVEAGKLAFRPGAVAVREALDEVAGILMPKQVSQGVEIKVQVAPSLTTVVNDPLRLRQMILNLADNAMKFSPRGGKVELRASARDGVAWCVEVEDHGIGIKPEDLDRLFQPFVQLSEGNTKAYGGTGLGLALVRQMARAQGGDVTVRSEFGAGSVFTLTLPRDIGRQEVGV